MYSTPMPNIKCSWVLITENMVPNDFMDVHILGIELNIFKII